MCENCNIEAKMRKETVKPKLLLLYNYWLFKIETTCSK